jgi:hypothetical protein
LRMLLQRLMRVGPVCAPELRGPEEVADLLMQRACRTSAGADSFFSIQRLLCAEDSFVTQNIGLEDDPPIHIDVFLAHQAHYNAHHRSTSTYTSNTIVSTTTAQNAVHPCSDDPYGGIPHLCARMLVSNSFSIYDSSAMEDSADLNVSPLPWLEVDSVVVDESDLLTKQHWRKLHLLVTHTATGRCFTSSDDTTDITTISTASSISNITTSSIHSRTTISNSSPGKKALFSGLTAWLSGNSSSSSTSSTTSSKIDNNIRKVGSESVYVDDGSTTTSSLQRDEVLSTATNSTTRSTVC